jgi:uncharacterized membrane protein YraQ (UPF0718 family)
MIKKALKRYSFFLIALSLTILITLLNKRTGIKTFNIAFSSFRQMLAVLPPIMILLGLMDVWIPREKAMKYMGPNSGITGVLLSIIIGSIGAGPMYAAFPFAAVLLKKGVKFSNIIIFMGAWCVTKIPTFLFELAALGYKFTFTRLLVNLPGIVVMGYLTQWLLPDSSLKIVYEKAEKIE